VSPAKLGIADVRISRFAETEPRWQRDPEGNAGALRAEGVGA